jgi:hypothetical protein
VAERPVSEDLLNNARCKDDAINKQTAELVLYALCSFTAVAESYHFVRHSSDQSHGRDASPPCSHHRFPASMCTIIAVVA